MPVTRMRMRPWLVMMIDSNTITGLEWVDKEKTMFTIPWKHAARHGWDLEKDACLFQKWAIHTGKYAHGQITDPKTWKANFRCALNSLPDIEEVKDRSINKGHQAKRVFRMLPVTPKTRDKRNKAKELKARRKSSIAKTDEEMEESSDTQSSTDESVPEEVLSPQENTVDSTVNTEQQELPFPDWSLSTEFTWNLPDNFCHRLEVSPDHSTDYEDPDEIIKICEELERDTLKMNPFNHNRPVSNYACTSPGGSQWSDSSSVDEAEEFRHYTTLGSDLIISTEDMYLHSFPGSLL